MCARRPRIAKITVALTLSASLVACSREEGATSTAKRTTPPAPQASPSAPATPPATIVATTTPVVTARPGTKLVVTPTASRFDGLPVALLNPAVAVDSEGGVYELYLIVQESAIDPTRIALLVLENPDTPQERKLVIPAALLKLTPLGGGLVKISVELSIAHAVVAGVLLDPGATLSGFESFDPAASPSPGPGPAPAQAPEPAPESPLPAAEPSPAPADPCAGIAARACPTLYFAGDASDYSGSTCTHDWNNADFSGANLRCAHWTIKASVKLKGANAAFGVFPKAYLSFSDLEGIDFTGADLREASFRQSNLRGAKLAKAQLDKVDLSADLTGADLNGATGLTRAAFANFATRLTDADLRGTGLVPADLTYDRISGVRAKFDCVAGPDERTKVFNVDHYPSDGANVRGITLPPGIYWGGPRLLCVDFRDVNAPSLDLSYATLERTTFAGAKMPDSRFVDLAMTNVSFGGADLRRANFSGYAFVTYNVDFADTDLTGALLKHTVWGVDFSRAKLGVAYAGSSYSDGTFVGADLSGATIHASVIDGTGAIFGNPLSCNVCDFTDSVLSGADLRSAKFIDVDFTRAKLRNTLLRGATITESSFAEADLTGADLRGTGLTKAALDAQGAITDGATFD